MESQPESRVARGTNSSSVRRQVRRTTVSRTWGLGAWYHRSVDGRLASSSSDGKGRRSGRGCPWQFAVPGRHTDTRRTHRLPDHVHVRHTWARRSTAAVDLQADMARSPMYTHTHTSNLSSRQYWEQSPTIESTFYSQVCLHLCKLLENYSLFNNLNKLSC